MISLGSPYPKSKFRTESRSPLFAQQVWEVSVENINTCLQKKWLQITLSQLYKEGKRFIEWHHEMWQSYFLMLGDMGKYVSFEGGRERLDKRENIKMPAEAAGRLMPSS